MKRLFLLFTLVLNLVIACQPESPQQPKQIEVEPKIGGVYRAALPFRPKLLDPAFSTDIYSVTIIQQIFDGLVQFDQNLNVVPALANSWRVSPDGLVYTFALRQDGKFHNGRSVTVDDFVYSFSRILKAKKKSSAFAFFKRIKGADAYLSGQSSEVSGLKAMGNYVLEITLKKPYAPFLSVLAMKSSKVVPREEVEKWGPDFGHHPVGTGPFLMEDFAPERIVLASNQDYHEGRPYLNKVIYSIYPGSQNEKIGEDFLTGRLEEAPLYGTIRESFSGESTYQFLRKPSLSLLFYGMNCQTTPLNNPLIRQGINYAINKRRIGSDVYKDQFVLAKTVLPPGMPGFTPENQRYKYDPRKAKELLEKAGYGPNRRPPPLTIVSASQSKLAQREFELVKRDLSTIGISLEVKYETDWPRFEALLRRGEFEMYRYAWFADIPDPDNFLSILCFSDSPYNFMGYTNFRVDKLLSDALTRVDPIARADLYREAEKVVLNDAPMVPLLYLTFESAFQSYVKGLEVSALGSPYIPLKKIWLDKD